MPEATQTRLELARAAVNAQTNPNRIIRVRRDTLFSLLEITQLSEDALDLREKTAVELKKRAVRENLTILHSIPAPATASAADPKSKVKSDKDEDEDEGEMADEEDEE